MLERVWRKGNSVAPLVGQQGEGGSGGPHRPWRAHTPVLQSPGCKLTWPLWKTVWRCLKKLKIPYDPVIPLLGINPEKTTIQKDTCTPMFIAALFTVAKSWKQPKCPSTEEQINKMWYIYTVE